jgi:hypothetical protein
MRTHTREHSDDGPARWWHRNAECYGDGRRLLMVAFRKCDLAFPVIHLGYGNHGGHLHSYS